MAGLELKTESKGVLRTRGDEFDGYFHQVGCRHIQRNHANSSNEYQDLAGDKGGQKRFTRCLANVSGDRLIAKIQCQARLRRGGGDDILDLRQELSPSGEGGPW